MLRKSMLALVSGAAVITFAAVPGLTASAAPVAHGKAAPTASHSDNVSSGPLVPVHDPASHSTRMLKPAQAAKAIRAYWTPQRMAAATPAPQARLGKAAKQTPAKPTGPQQSRSPVLSQAARAARALGMKAADVPFTSAEGVAFYFDPGDGQNHYCSAAAMNSNNHSVVLTAGHCIHDGGGGGWMQNWVFDPGYENGNPGGAGTFAATFMGAKNEWINNADRHYDYAFADVGTNSAGQQVTDAVGGNGWITNPGRPNVTLIGYPGNKAGGQVQWWCAGGTSRRSIFISDQEIGCDWGPGSSGSPWLENYNTSFPLLGWVISDTSYYIGSFPPIYGPYYDDGFSSLFTFVGG